MSDVPATLMDASAWLAAIDPDDPHHEAARHVVLNDATLALDLTLYEVTNVTVRAWIAPGRARAALDFVIGTVSAPPIAVTPESVRAAIGIAERHGITVYDASYVAVADELGVRLVSCDVRDLVSKGLAVLPSAVR